MSNLPDLHHLEGLSVGCGVSVEDLYCTNPQLSEEEVKRRLRYNLLIGAVVQQSENGQMFYVLQE